MADEKEYEHRVDPGLAPKGADADYDDVEVDADPLSGFDPLHPEREESPEDTGEADRSDTGDDPDKDGGEAADDFDELGKEARTDADDDGERSEKGVDELIKKARQELREEFMELSQRQREEHEQRINSLIQERELESELVSAGSEIDQVESELAQARTEYESALQDGDPVNTREAMEKVSDIKAKKASLEQRKKQAEEKIKEAKEAKPGKEAGQGERPVPEEARRWISRNASWFNDPEYARARTYAIAVDQDLARKGLDPTKREYYRELDKEITKVFPDLAKPAGARTDSPVATPGGNGRGDPDKPGQQRRRRGKVRLSDGQKRNMRDFGLDPSNPEHVREYARNAS